MSSIRYISGSFLAQATFSDSQNSPSLVEPSPPETYTISSGSNFAYWPSGAFFAYRAWAIGAGGDAANEILEAEYRDNLTMDEALLLGMKCMTKVLEGKAEPQKIRVAIIPRETGKFQKLPVEEVDKYLRKLDAGKKAPAGK